MGNLTSTCTHTCLKSVPVLMGMGFDGCGCGYSWVPKPMWVWTTGSMIFNAARRETLPVMSICVFQCGREGKTLLVTSSCVFRHSREGETLCVASSCVF